MDEPQLIQLQHPDPWRMLTVCILLNVTQRKQVDRVVDTLFENFPTPYEMGRAHLPQLASILRPLGIQDVRAARLRFFSRDWARHLDEHEEPPTETELLAMHGIGGYALDAYRLFVLKRFDVEPLDKELHRWWEWKTNKLQKT